VRSGGDPAIGPPWSYLRELLPAWIASVIECCERSMDAGVEQGRAPRPFEPLRSYEVAAIDALSRTSDLAQ